MILKENVLFLEEWIRHHNDLGFTSFVLYDDTGSHREGNGVNRYGMDFDHLINLNDAETEELARKIVKSFDENEEIDIQLIKDGGPGKLQPHAIKEYVKNYQDRVNWTLFTDTDEFLMNTTDISALIEDHPSHHNFLFNQVKFSGRWCHLEDAVRDIQYSVTNINTKNWAPKLLIQTKLVDVEAKWNIHSIKTVDKAGPLHVDVSQVWFNHYNVNQKQIEWMSKSWYHQDSFEWSKNSTAFYPNIKSSKPLTFRKLNYVNDETYQELKDKNCVKDFTFID